MNSNKNKLNSAINKVFEIAEDFDIIEKKSPKEIITKKISDDISKEVLCDWDSLIKLFPHSIRELKGKGDEPTTLFVDIDKYCFPNLFSIYISLKLAREWNAESLFPDSVYNYCKYKFGLSLIKNNKSIVTSFNSIFNMISPEKDLIPYYALSDLKNSQNICAECKKKQRCEDNYIKDLERNVHSYLELRDYDEIQQIKHVIKEIISKLNRSDLEYSNEDVIKEFRSQNLKINRDLRSSFPKIKRWSNLFLIASIPTTLLSLNTGLPAITYTAATIAGVSEVAIQAMEYQKSKYQWIAFMHNRRTNNIKPHNN